MTAFERFRNRLDGKSVDRPPNFNIFMTFAAHYIGKPLYEYYNDYRVLVDANKAMIEDFHTDIAQAISDPYREAADLGLQVEFPPDALPVSKIPLIQDTTDLHKLKPIKPEDGRRMNDRLLAVRSFHDEYSGKVPVMGWVEGALAEAADLRGVSILLMDLYMQPKWVHELLEFCCEMAIDFAKAQVQAGADIIGLGDAIASQISPEFYEEFAQPYERRIFEAVKALGATPRLHICGDTSEILGQMAETGAEIIDLDWMVNWFAASHFFGMEGPAICGNFDPVAVLLQGSPQDVAEAVNSCVSAGGPKAFIMAGCEVPDGTPHENLHAVTRALTS